MEDTAPAHATLSSCVRLFIEMLLSETRTEAAYEAPSPSMFAGIADKIGNR